jgi:hypothetical protein
LELGKTSTTINWADRHAITSIVGISRHTSRRGAAETSLFLVSIV